MCMTPSKTSPKGATSCLLSHKDISCPHRHLRQIWSIWKDYRRIRQKKKWGHPRQEIYRFSLVQTHHWPFCREAQYCKTRRDKSGWDCRERQGVKENKRIHSVRMIDFWKSKWTTEGEKEKTFSVYSKGAGKWLCRNALRHDAEKKHFAWYQTTGVFHFSSFSTYKKNKKNSISQSIKWQNPPQW